MVPGGTSYSAVDGPGGLLLGGTTYSMTDLPSLLGPFWMEVMPEVQVSLTLWGDSKE